MPVQNWMTTDVVSVGPDTSLLKVGKLMKDHHIRRIPVVDDNGQVVGIISDRDVLDAPPSKTMEVRKVPGLSFIGEGVDVTGWLGGYNFQWAWSSGWVAGQYC